TTPTAAATTTAVARLRRGRGAGDRRRRGDRVGRVWIRALDAARWRGQRTRGLRRERRTPSRSERTEPGVIEVGRVRALRAASHARPLRGPRAPRPFGFRPGGEVALPRGEVEEAAGALRADAAVLPQQAR